MAADPKLPRFARPSRHWPKGGQSRIDRQGRAVCKSAPWQHLQMEVLHFVCELRGPIVTGLGFAKTRSCRLALRLLPGVMGPGLRRDDSGERLRAIPLN